MCERCGTAMPAAARGRPRRWCSGRCRQAAWAVRDSPTVEVATTPEQAVDVVLSSPVAVRELIRTLTVQLDADNLDDRVIDALNEAHQAVVRSVMRGVIRSAGRS